MGGSFSSGFVHRLYLNLLNSMLIYSSFRTVPIMKYIVLAANGILSIMLEKSDL